MGTGHTLFESMTLVAHLGRPVDDDGEGTSASITKKGAGFFVT